MILMYKIGAALVLVLLLIAGVNKGVDAIGDARERLVVARYTKAIEAQNSEAERLLRAVEAKVTLAETSLTIYRTEQEKTDASNSKINAGLRTQLRVAAPAGRLRDPYASCGPSSPSPASNNTASADNSSGDPTSSGGFLSAEITGLLFDEAEKNDTINNAYAACRADSFRVREILNVK